MEVEDGKFVSAEIIRPSGHQAEIRKNEDGFYWWEGKKDPNGKIIETLNRVVYSTGKDRVCTYERRNSDGELKMRSLHGKEKIWK